MTLEQHRLRWKCRRGLLELDLILERFFLQYPGEQKAAELLDLPDNDLLDIVMGRSDAYGPHLNDLVARLRAA
jgi:succinate dehydrogenase flavin-adding protein (antitoxin of CptAB toxin-antitoxin module)